MARFTQQSIERVRRQCPVYDVVNPVVTLQRAGSEYKGLSPFTNEKSPSFMVNPAKNVWYCFSSARGGDVIKFVMETEQLEFAEAVEALAERFNITLDFEESSGSGPLRAEQRSLRKQLFEIHELAADYFHRCLRAENEEGAFARAYWEEQRGFTPELAREFKVGWAPSEGHALREGLVQKGFGMEALRACGLFFARESDTEPRRLKGRFRGRLMIPIRDASGRIVAFTARQTEKTPEDDPAREAKYVNSPETPLFHKSDLLFNLDRARRHIGKDEERFLLVEGQLDCLRCWEKGLKGAIAPQGTALTEGQLGLLRRYGTKLDCLLDGDRAGKSAALRLLPLALKAGIEVRFVALPEGSDPDDLLREGGREALEALRGTAQSAIPFACRALLPQKEPGAVERAEAMEKLFAILREAESEVVRSTYLAEAAAAWRVEERALRADFERFSGRRPAPAAPVASPQKPAGELTNAETALLLLVFHQEPAWGEAIVRAVHPDWPDTSQLEGRVLGRVLAAMDEGLWDGTESLDQLLEGEEERSFAYALLARDPGWKNPRDYGNDALRVLHTRSIENQLAILRHRLANLPPGADDYPRIKAEQRTLREALKSPPQLHFA